MDSKELFKQLTCGVIFTKSSASKRALGRKGINSESAVPFPEKEIKEEDISIKSEEESDNEAENSQIQILSDAAMPVLTKKKKKKVTPEQLKNWETEKVSAPGSSMNPLIVTFSHSFQINHLRNKYHIHVNGSNPADPLETFDEMKTNYGFDSQVFDNLFSCGYNTPTPIQMQAIPAMASVS